MLDPVVIRGKVCQEGKWKETPPIQLTKNSAMVVPEDEGGLPNWDAYSQDRFLEF
jgi:hypothetical protein